MNGGSKPTNQSLVPVDKKIIRSECAETDPFEQKNKLDQESRGCETEQDIVKKIVQDLKDRYTRRGHDFKSPCYR